MDVLEVLNKAAVEGASKVFKQGNNINAWAVYEFEVLGVKAAMGFNKKLNASTTYFTPEFRVVSCKPTKSPEELDAAKVPISRRPNAEGSSASLPLPIVFDWAKGKMIDYLSAQTGEAYEEFGKKKTVNGIEKTLIQILTDEQLQPLKGCRIMCEATDKPLKGKEGSTNPDDYRTRTRWFHTPETQAVTDKVLGRKAA